MLKRLAVAVTFFVLCAGFGCSKSPSKVFSEMEESAREGDVDKFGSYFTEDSRPFASALLALYKMQGGAEGSALDLLVKSEVVSEEIDNDRELATIKAKTAGQRMFTVVFKKEGGKWKVDLRETEKANGFVESSDQTAAAGHE
jgi:hypothetical protein